MSDLISQFMNELVGIQDNGLPLMRIVGGIPCCLKCGGRYRLQDADSGNPPTETIRFYKCDGCNRLFRWDADAK